MIQDLKFRYAMLISKQSILGKLLKITKLIVWNEAPMVHRCTFEALDKMLRDFIECKLPFSGNVIMCRGIFRQVLPII